MSVPIAFGASWRFSPGLQMSTRRSCGHIATGARHDHSDPTSVQWSVAVNRPTPIVREPGGSVCGSIGTYRVQPGHSVVKAHAVLRFEPRLLHHGYHFLRTGRERINAFAKDPDFVSPVSTDGVVVVPNPFVDPLDKIGAAGTRFR